MGNPKRWPSRRALLAMSANRAAKKLDEAFKHSRSAVTSFLLKGPSNPAPMRHRLYDIAELERAYSDLGSRSGESRESLMKTYRTMQLRGPWRPLATAPDQFAHQTLREDFPNFAAVIDFIECQLALCRMSPAKVAYFPPTLLLGDPGVGKTALAKRIAAALFTSYEEIVLPGATAAFTLTGLSSGWAGGREGRVATALQLTGNPVVLLDEIDKAGGDSRYDVGNSFLALLERHSAARFIDEYLELPIDASRIMWIATANSTENIPAPLLSRFHMFRIAAPDTAQARNIACSVYRTLLSSFEWGIAFPDELPEPVLVRLRDHRPREQYQLLMRALGAAARGGRNTLSLEDFPYVVRSASRIGF